MFLSQNAGRLNVPLGFYIPFVNWNLNFSVARAPTFPGEIVQAMFFVVFCAATGWVSGLVTAFAYNLISKHSGFQLRGSIESQPFSES